MPNWRIPSDQKQKFLVLHRHIKAVVLGGSRNFKTLRERWVEAVEDRVDGVRGSNKVFIGLVCMILSAVETDKHLLQTLVPNLPYACPRTLFRWAKEEGGWKDGSLKSLVSILGKKAHLCQHNNKKSNYIVFAAIIFILNPKTAVEDPAGMLAFHGIGLKMLFETQQGMLDNTIGIGCDIHMVRMFSKLGWISTNNDHTAAALEMMSWMPKEEWGCMNKCYAGLGQILQSTQSKRNAMAKALRKQLEDEPELLQSLNEVLDLKEYKGLQKYMTEAVQSQFRKRN